MIETLIRDKYGEIIKEVYGAKSGKYCGKTLATALEIKNPQVLSKPLQDLERWGVIKRRKEKFKEKTKKGIGGTAKYIYHTPYGTFLYTALSPPDVNALDKAIKELYVEKKEIPSLDEIAQTVERSLYMEGIKPIIDQRLKHFKNNIGKVQTMIRNMDKNDDSPGMFQKKFLPDLKARVKNIGLGEEMDDEVVETILDKERDRRGRWHLRA
ncbi:MAG: hypothetical protein ACP5FL_03910 [Thermoplasmatota archaeon]